MKGDENWLHSPIEAVKLEYQKSFKWMSCVGNLHDRITWTAKFCKCLIESNMVYITKMFPNKVYQNSILRDFVPNKQLQGNR